MKTYKTLKDFADDQSIVLFNHAGDMPDVVDEWAEAHTCKEEGMYGECQCEVMQWYAIEMSEGNAEYINKTYHLGIFYSDTLGIYIMPVYNFGMVWEDVKI